MSARSGTTRPGSVCGSGAARQQSRAVSARSGATRPGSVCDSGVTRLASVLRILLGAALLTGAGCQSAHVRKPLPAAVYGSDADAQMEFWHSLADQKVTTNNAAFHGVLLFLDNADPSADYNARVAALKARHLLPAGFDRAADEAVLRGTLAVTLVQSLHIKGGLMLTAFGPTTRYCLRELEYQGLYPVSSENQTFSGAEFLGVIGKMDDYQKSHKPTGLPPTTVQPTRNAQT